MDGVAPLISWRQRTRDTVNHHHTRQELPGEVIAVIRALIDRVEALEKRPNGLPGEERELILDLGNLVNSMRLEAVQNNQRIARLEAALAAIHGVVRAA